MKATKAQLTTACRLLRLRWRYVSGGVFLIFRKGSQYVHVGPDGSVLY